MAGSTPIYGFPYPDPSDLVANYPALGQDLAEDVETVIDGLGQGLHLITAQTFTASSAVNVNNCFTSAYTAYRVIFQAQGSATANTWIRFRVGGSDETSGNYFYGMVGIDWNGSAANVNATGQTLALFARTAANNRAFSVWDIMQPQAATNTRMLGMIYSDNAGTDSFQTGLMMLNTGSQYDGMSIFPNSGTITGTLRIYGYQNS